MSTTIVSWVCAVAPEPSVDWIVQDTESPGETIELVKLIVVPEPMVCPFTVQVYVSVVVSSGSKMVAEHVNDVEVTTLVFGVMAVLEMVGVVFMTCRELSTGIPSLMPSVGVTTTFQTSPLLVLEASKIGVVIPAVAPLTNHS